MMAFFSKSTGTATAGAAEVASSAVPSLPCHLHVTSAFASGDTLMSTRANVLHRFPCWWPCQFMCCFLELGSQWNRSNLVQLHMVGLKVQRAFVSWARGRSGSPPGYETSCLTSCLR